MGGHGSRAYVVLDLADDGAAEGVEVAVVLEAPHHFLRGRLPPHVVASDVGHREGGAAAPILKP